MSGPSASSGEMPGFSSHHGSASELDESVLDMLLTGQPLPDDAPRQARMTADALASLGDPQCPGALAGEVAARSAFARKAGAPVTEPPPTRPYGRRARLRRSVRVRPRLAAVAAAAAVLFGSTVGAAYAGVLPAAIQDFAHLTVGAPAPHHVAPSPHPHKHAQRPSRGTPGAAPAHHGALGHGAKANSGHGKALGKRNSGHPRNPHAHAKAPAEPKAHRPHAQSKAHA
jgi:hypothetical protein